RPARRAVEQGYWGAANLAERTTTWRSGSRPVIADRPRPFIEQSSLLDIRKEGSDPREIPGIGVNLVGKLPLVLLVGDSRQPQLRQVIAAMHATRTLARPLNRGQ